MYLVPWSYSSTAVFLLPRSEPLIGSRRCPTTGPCATCCGRTLKVHVQVTWEGGKAEWRALPVGVCIRMVSWICEHGNGTALSCFFSKNCSIFSLLSADIEGWGISPRGAGYLFGSDVVAQVCIN